jgi:hypothetical protein
MTAGETAKSTDSATIARCKRRYRVVLVDGGQVDQPLSVALARQCDAVWLIVELGRTMRDRAVIAAAQLAAQGVKLAGTIVVGNATLSD